MLEAEYKRNFGLIADQISGAIAANSPETVS
jgi:hypothetical protein